MKEIFDWLREQTINVWKLKKNPYDSYWNRAMYLEIKKENDKKEDAMRKMQEIIAEAEAKWEADYCEWKPCDKVKNALVVHGEIYYRNCVIAWKYCPHCGKQIKISEE